jgi:hypothetical protein
MTRALLIALVGLSVSCHAPSNPPRATDDPMTTGAQAIPPALESEQPEPEDPAAPNIEDPPAWAPRADEHLVTEPDDPPIIDLCCDKFAGLCYRDEGIQCASATSAVVSCPTISVREIDAVSHIVVCVE